MANPYVGHDGTGWYADVDGVMTSSGECPTELDAYKWAFQRLQVVATQEYDAVRAERERLRSALKQMIAASDQTLFELGRIRDRMRDPRLMKHVAAIEWTNAIRPWLDALSAADSAIDATFDPALHSEWDGNRG